ncbi:MAG: hypothetical protein AAFU66_07815 [Pseudomonadota bacterium]
MDSERLVELASWCRQWLPITIENYSPLREVLTHNASHNNQQPVQPHLEGLIKFLNAMPTHHLNRQQMDVLDRLSVAHLIGKSGATWVNDAVQTTVFDPASTRDNVSMAFDLLKVAEETLHSFHTTAGILGLDAHEPETDLPPFRVTVIFRSEAAIRDVAELNREAKIWEQIVSGIAGAVGERPQDIKIVGASSGSILLTLAASAAATGLLALISKHGSRIASDFIEVAETIEDLRHKKAINAEIEEQMRQLLSQRKEKIVDDTLDEIQEQIGKKVDAEVKGKLKLSVEKLLDFRQRGGDVDFAAGRESSESEEEKNELDGPLREVGKIIEDANKARQQLDRIQQQLGHGNLPDF